MVNVVFRPYDKYTKTIRLSIKYETPKASRIKLRPISTFSSQNNEAALRSFS